MEISIFNYTHQALVLYTVETEPTTNNSNYDFNVTRSPGRLHTPWALTLVLLLVFIISPMIIIANSLILVAICRFKRLRTPSNYLITSLAISDLGVGTFMSLGTFLESVSYQQISIRACLLNYGIVITLCCVSVLVMVAIAVDRFTSLAKPLRYPNLITHTAVERYIFVFWVYSAIVGFSPMGYLMVYGTANENSAAKCSFGMMVARPVQLFMFCAVYGPSALVLLTCYSYVYIVARGHARAIFEVRQSLCHNHSTIASRRYGVTLALTSGLFIILWLPFQICMLTDVFAGTNILSHWTSVFPALPILASSAINPWLYGYRNSEIRAAIRRILDDLLNAVGFSHGRRLVSSPNGEQGLVTAGDPASFIHHVQKEYCSAIRRSMGDLLLIPVSKSEKPSIIIASDDSRIFKKGSPIRIEKDRPPRSLRLSKSMVESFAVASGRDVLIVPADECKLKHGASVI